MTKPTAFKFTKTSLSALPFADRGHQYRRDLDTRGLAIRVGTNSKTFYFIKKVDGRTEFMRLGGFPEMTVEQARRKVAQINGELVMGTNRADSKRLRKEEMTLGELFEAFLKHRRTKRGNYLSAKTKLDYRKNYDRHLSELANRKLSKISASDLTKLHSEIGSEAPYMANRVIALVSSMYNFARDSQEIRITFSGTNPAADIQPFHEEARARYLQVDELPAFWDALAKEPNRDFADVFLIALLTGARISDVLGMRWRDVNLVRAEWRIPKAKNGDPHIVPLIREIVDLLLDRQGRTEDSEWIFPGTGKTGHLAEPKGAWKRILREAKLDDIRIHDLRRSMGSSMAAAGVNTITTARTLGHKTLTMALRYQQLSTDPKRAALEAGAKHILDAANQTPASAVKGARNRSRVNQV